MIARVWKARATPKNAPAYREHLQTHVFPVLRSIAGFIDVQLWQRVDGEEVEFVVVSRWERLAAVKEFAGEAYERAIVAPGARAVLSSFDEVVEHYDVSAEAKQ